MMCPSNAQMLLTSEAQEDTESSELFGLCRFCWGGGVQLWKDMNMSVRCEKHDFHEKTMT